MAKARALKVPSEHLLVAERFRGERMSERFGQAELAQEIGVTRPTVSNFEYGVSRVSFSAGYAFCRRLDINPRWLATGAEPKRPFVEPGELGIDTRDLESRLRRGVDFLTGYAEVLEKPITAWLRKTPPDQIIQRYIDGGPELLARRLSHHELESKLIEIVVSLKNEREEMKIAHLKNAEAMLAEMKTRLLTRYPSQRRLWR